jgi:hypothetical protein
MTDGTSIGKMYVNWMATVEPPADNQIIGSVETDYDNGWKEAYVFFRQDDSDYPYGVIDVSGNDIVDTTIKNYDITYCRHVYDTLIDLYDIEVGLRTHLNRGNADEEIVRIRRILLTDAGGGSSW